MYRMICRNGLGVMSVKMPTIYHDSGIDRQKLEKYFTPEETIKAVLSIADFTPSDLIFDPCAGDGQVLRACWSSGLFAYGCDILPDAPGISQGNFFEHHQPVRNILTNPPYGAQGRMAVRFIEHALELTKPTRGKVIMLLRADFDSAPGRVRLFRDHPAFDRRGVLLHRVRWTNVKQTDGKGPSTNHTWFCWDWPRLPGLPTTHYIGA
jgi:hypothetical protein